MAYIGKCILSMGEVREEGTAQISMLDSVEPHEFGQKKIVRRPDFRGCNVHNRGLGQ